MRPGAGCSSSAVVGSGSNSCDDRVTTMAISDGGQVVLLVGGGGLVVAEMQGNGDTTYSCAVENIAKPAQFSRLSGVGQTQHFCTRFGYI